MNSPSMQQNAGRSIQILLTKEAAGAAHEVLAFVVCFLERVGLSLTRAPEEGQLLLHEWRFIYSGADVKVAREGIEICIESEAESSLITVLIHSQAVKVNQQFVTLAMADPQFVAQAANNRIGQGDHRPHPSA